MLRHGLQIGTSVPDIDGRARLVGSASVRVDDFSRGKRHHPG